MRAKKNNNDVSIDIESKSKREKKSRWGKIIASIVVGFIMWGAMLFIANSIINESKHVTVYRAKEDMADGTKITSENIDSMVEACSISEDLVPSGYITDKSKLVGVFTNKDYQAREIITVAGISTEESMTRHIKDPVEISVSASSIDAAVGGILREGDYINIYYVSSNSNSESTARLIMENAYVTKALDSNGVEISRSDEQTVATVFNLVIPKEVESKFHEELMSGTVRMSLVYNPDIEKAQESVNEDTEASELAEEENKEGIVVENA